MASDNNEAAASGSQPMIRPLHLLTIEILLAELISGRPIVTSEGQQLSLSTDHARSILNWYRINRAKWASNLSVQDCDAIVDAISLKPPVLTAPEVAAAQSIKRFKLARLVAHRFAGLHSYGTATQAPEDFVFEPDSPIMLFEGWNGSGKTSLANAIIWCLTGQLLRPQRLPENAGDDFDCLVERDDGLTSAHGISPVTPLPHVDTWTPDETVKAVPADTWVELTFTDDDGKFYPPLRRAHSRKSNGKLVESAPLPSDLGVDPIAFRLGTTMPGILPFLQIGSTSELGVAIAKLTGLADLVDLARHAEKVAARIGGPMTKERQADLERLTTDFVQQRTDLSNRITEFPAMTPPEALPSIKDADAAEKCGRLIQYFEALKAKGLSDAKEVLGNAFNPEDPNQRKNLEDCIGPAIELLKKARNLQSIERLGTLKLDNEAVAGVQSALAKLRGEAAMLAELAENPTLARRTQLYARVATWMVEHDHPDDDSCAVCRTSLIGLVDPETGATVAEQLARLRHDGEIVAKTISQWAKEWSGSLARDLPEPIRNELRRDLPKSPADLLRAGLCDDLFAADPFRGTLAALKPLTAKLVDEVTGTLPAFSEPESELLPERVRSAAGDLSSMIHRIDRVIGFVEWMRLHSDDSRAAINRVRTGEEDGVPVADSPTDPSQKRISIGSSLERLDFIVKGVAPISAAISLCQRLANGLVSFDRAQARLLAYKQAIKAIVAIVPVGALAQVQVEGLRRTLHGRAEYWRNQLYQNATTFAPQPQDSGMNARGVIDIHVGRGSVLAPAQHVSNASALRAALTGFYLAFREHVLKSSGGITTLILDDPQDLLDYDNRQRLARAVARIASDGSQILVTTHDRGFARTLVAEGRTADLIAHRAVHPVNDSRQTLQVSLAVEELDRKRSAFVSNRDSASHAQDYANEARIFIEARLGDLFDDPAYPAHSTVSKAPTLIPLFERLKGLVSARSNELFKSPVLAEFCSDPAMGPGAEARRILNQSHHDKASISYAEVEKVDVDLKRLRGGIERVHGEFRQYRWREPLTTEVPSNVVPLQSVKAPTFSIPISQDIAAFTGHLPEGGSQADELEVFPSTWFDDKGLFYIRHDTMGFAIPSGAIAIVEMEPTNARDHSLVVARRGTQVYARRLLRPRNGEGFSLAAESPDPRDSRPTLAFEDHGVAVHRVVGALFSQTPPPKGREEAIEVSGEAILEAIEVGYRVREDSAVPLALPGQMILGGKALLAADLSAMEGEIVALTLDDGTSILKRVGAPVSSALPYLRQFETIGGLGNSVVIMTEAIEGAPNIPIMSFARPIIGVIYDY